MAIFFTQSIGDVLRNMLSGLTKMYSKAYKEAYKEESIENREVSAEEWETFFLYNTITPSRTRELLFQYFHSVSEELPVGDFAAHNQDIFDHLKNMKTSNEKTLLDRMSLQLLQNFSQLSHNEESVLKYQKDQDDALSFVLLKRLELIKQAMKTSFEYQVLQVFDRWIETVHKCKKTGKKSETEIVARVNEFVMFFLEDTDLNTKAALFA